jgi:hypothetical protein
VQNLQSDTKASVGHRLAPRLPHPQAAGAAVRGYLFGVQARDGVTLAIASAFVVASALVAAWIPARRAPHVNPAAMLRAD